MHCQVHVRESRAAVQRSKAAAVVIAEPDRVEASTAPAEERNISRRPDRTVERVSVSRTGPPTPSAVDLHPAAVVIRSPAPVVIRNPGPSPIWFVDPATIAVRSPAGRLVWPPHLTVIGYFRPGAMTIEIFGPDVIVVGVAPRFRVADHGVAIGVPLVPVIPCRRFANLVLRLIASARDGNELASADARAALWSRNFYFAFADEYLSVIVGSHQNSEAGFAALGANRSEERR